MRIPLILAVIAIIFSVAVDLYIFFDIKTKSRLRLWRRVYAVSSFACWAFLMALILWPKRSGDSDILGVMWMLYVYLSIYFAKFAYVVISIIGRLVRLIAKPKFKWRPSCRIGIVAALVVFAVMWEGILYTRYDIDVNRVDISSPRLPKSFDGYKIAQISDLHVGTWGNDTTFISNLVDSVNALKPDLIVFTGDIVNRRTEELEPFISPLSRLSAPDGVFSILGNHDYGDYMDWDSPAQREANNRLLADYQAKMGWRLLNNERDYVMRGNDSITVVGVENWGDPPFAVYGDLEKAIPSSRDSLHNQNDRCFKLLLTHNPEHWNRVVSKSTNFDLTLSGHTHAMQMMIQVGGWKWSPAKYRYELWGGLYERLNDEGKTTRLYVNIGAGEVGMPSRLLGANPEITLFSLPHEGI